MIFHGNSLHVLKQIEDNKYTAIVTDPPYALEFLGKEWDKTLPDKRIWEELLRVTKPGGWIMAFGGSRTFHRLAVDIEDAGWNLRDTMMWLYGTGFPTGNDISKAIDKTLGAERSHVIVPMKKIRNSKVVGGGKDTGIDGTRPYIKRARERGFHVMESDIPVTPKAKSFQGYNTTLKPSYEPIVLAMKPLEGSYAQNALRFGVSGLNLGGLRKLNGGDKSKWPCNVIMDHIAYQQIERESLGKLKSNNRTFYVPKPNKAEKGKFNTHPTVKPLQLMRYLLQMVKMPNNQTYILDPFCGSGTTLVAAEQIGVRCDGIEMNEEYIEIIKKRIENIRQQKAKKRKRK